MISINISIKILRHESQLKTKSYLKLNQLGLLATACPCTFTNYTITKWFLSGCSVFPSPQ